MDELTQEIQIPIKFLNSPGSKLQAKGCLFYQNKKDNIQIKNI